MKKLAFILLLVPFCLVGCGAFGQGFTNEMSKALADDLGAAVDRSLSDDFKGVGGALADGIKGIPKQPEAPSPLYDLGAAAAIIVAFFARGAMRKYNVFGAGEVRVKKDG